MISGYSMWHLNIAQKVIFQKDFPFEPQSMDIRQFTNLVRWVWEIVAYLLQPTVIIPITCLYSTKSTKTLTEITATTCTPHVRKQKVS